MQRNPTHVHGLHVRGLHVRTCKVYVEHHGASIFSHKILIVA